MGTDGLPTLLAAMQQELAGEVQGVLEVISGDMDAEREAFEDVIALISHCETVIDLAVARAVVTNLLHRYAFRYFSMRSSLRAQLLPSGRRLPEAAR